MCAASSGPISPLTSITSRCSLPIQISHRVAMSSGKIISGAYTSMPPVVAGRGRAIVLWPDRSMRPTRAPQKRHRAIFMGVAQEFGEDWSFPAPTHSQEALAWAKHVDLSYWKKHHVRRTYKAASETEARLVARLTEGCREPATQPWVTVRDAIFDLPKPAKAQSSTGHWQHPGARVYPNHTWSCLTSPPRL